MVYGMYVWRCWAFQLSKEVGCLWKQKDTELSSMRREKDELAKNHSLVMSERDSVHKEIDTLSERLVHANNQVCILSSAHARMF